MKTLFIVSVVTTAFAFPATGELTGRWESKSETGNITGVLFKPGNTFEGYVNKKPFVTGTYTYSSAEGIFTLIDNGCNGESGTYKIHFYANGDSMRFTAITDACNERKAGMERLNMGKVKEYDGFIAQDVMKVFPNLVAHNVNEKRNIDMYTLNYDGFGVIAIKAIQELVQIVKEQEDRITALEQKSNTASSNIAENSITKIPFASGASLEQNQPNPFNSSTTIRYQVPQGSKAQLQIFDAAGTLVKTIVANGSGVATILAGELSAGTYTYNLIVNGKPTAAKKMILMK